MPAPASIDELVGLIRKSGMLDEPRLETYLQHLNSHQELPTDPKKLAAAMVRDGMLTFFQADQFMLGKWRGFTLGKYKLLERIGIGGMGQVFLCEHLYMRRRVAIKILPPAKAEEPAALGRFYREARAAGILDHPNIVRTHDIDQDGQFHFLVMEYVDGSSTLELVKRFGPLDVLRAANYMSQAATALDHAHRAGLVHRDLKPGNLMVDREGTVKLLDLGLARFYHDHQDVLTLKYDENSVLGTADYVAPEQTINSHTVDIRADIYGLGATFYFLLAGHPPFPEGTVSQKLHAQQTKQPTPIRQIRPEVPEGLMLVLNRMMAKDLRHRYQTPDEVVASLAPWASMPVALPREDEMPQLCPAAQGSAPEQRGNTATRSSHSISDMSSSHKMPMNQSNANQGSASRPAFAMPGQATPQRMQPASQPGSNSSSDTRPMSNSLEHTPVIRERPPTNPDAMGHSFTHELPRSEPPSTGRLIALVLMAALIGSGLAVAIWWKLKG